MFVVGNHTLDVKGTNGAPVKGGGKEKDMITLMLAAMGNGEKLKPVLISKGVRHPQKVTKATIRYQISKPLQHGLPSASRMCYEVSYGHGTAML